MRTQTKLYKIVTLGLYRMVADKRTQASACMWRVVWPKLH